MGHRIRFCSTVVALAFAALAVPDPGAATPARPAGRTLSVLMTGDVLPELPVLVTAEQAGRASGQRYDFRSLFAPITPLVSSYDLAICQMEIPIGTPEQAPGVYGRSPYGGNQILAPYELAAGLAATGYDRCTTASNHSYDLYDAGIASTIEALAANGISSSGTARTPEEAIPRVFEVHGVRVGHVSYTDWSNNGWPSASWQLAMVTEVDQVAADVETLRAGGAEIVLVSIHLSAELSPTPDPATVSAIERLVSIADVDAVVHHGPHVVQPFALVGDVPVWWSVGNLVSGMARPNPQDRYTDPRTRDGLAAVMHFSETVPGVWSVQPGSVTLCNEQVSRIVHPASALDDAGATLSDGVRAELAECLARTRTVLADAG
ncbi:MAG: CapA family protein [Desertimonas sp.]